MVTAYVAEALPSGKEDFKTRKTPRPYLSESTASFSPTVVMCFCKVTLLFQRKKMSFDKKAGLPACGLSYVLLLGTR